MTTIQRKIELAADEVAHCTKAERETNILKRTPDDVRTREEAAARCTKVINRRVLIKQARKPRAEHLERCCLALGKKKAPRNLLPELHGDGHLTEDRRNVKKNNRGIVKRFSRIRKRRKRY